MKRITINANTTLKYLQIWNGIFNLTEMELKILSVLIDMSESLDDICNASIKKQAATILEIKDYRTLNNYVKRLKDKGAISLNKKFYKLNTILNPKVNDVHITVQHD